MIRALSAVAPVLVAVLAAADEVTWNYDISTRGQDVVWTSPTAVDPTVPEYDADYAISGVYATVQYLIFPETTIEVTSEIPPEYLSGSGMFYGPPPLTIFDQTFEFPPPPDPVAVSATLNLSVLGDGHGQLTATDITLGTYRVNLPPFGTVTVNIRGIRVVGSVVIRAIYPGDLDRDSDVDISDLALFLASFGACAADPLYNYAADLDGNGCINISDLALFLSNFGRG